MSRDFESYRVKLTEEDKQVIRESIDKTVESFNFQHIGYVSLVGTILNKGETRDVDIVMFTGADSKVGESLIESFTFYQELEQTLKDEHPRYHLSIFPMKVKQELTNYINSVQRGETALIPIHDLFFPDKYTMHEKSPATFCEAVAEQAKPLYGSYDDVPRQQSLSLDQQKPDFWLLQYAILSILGRFPDKLVKAKMEGAFNYLKKYHDVPIPDENLHTQEGVFKATKQVLQSLDDKHYE